MPIHGWPHGISTLVRCRETDCALSCWQNMARRSCLQNCKAPLIRSRPPRFIEARPIPICWRVGKKEYTWCLQFCRDLPLVDAGGHDFATLGSCPPTLVAQARERGDSAQTSMCQRCDVPDREVNEKFGQKLDYLRYMRDWFHGDKPEKSNSGR